MTTIMHRPIPHPQRSPSLCRLRLALLGLLLQLQLHSVQGQSRRQQESTVCTIEPRPVLVGLGSSPDYDQYGIDASLSLDGSTAAIGANNYGSDKKGYVQAFRFQNNNTWTQLGRTIFGDISSQTFTNALSDDGSILAVGGWFASNVRVFRLVDDDWEPLGNNITNPSGNDIGFALSISGDGTIVAASSPRFNIGDHGEVRVFERMEGMWSQKGSTLQGQGGEQFFGGSISLSQDGRVLAVGIPEYDNGETNGYVRVFEFIDNDWVQIGQTLEGSSAGALFGADVSLSSDGRSLAVGSPYYSDGIFDNLGSVHVYRYGSNREWLEPGSMLIGKSKDDFFGVSLALSGDASILVVCGPGVVSGIGGLRLFDADGERWIEVGEEATNSNYYNTAAISRDGSTAMGGASIFDISCQQGTAIPSTPNAVLLPLPSTPAPGPRPMSAPLEAPPETPIAAPVLSALPTGNMEPPDDNSSVSSPTTTSAAAETSPTSAPGPNPDAGAMVQETLSDVSLSFSGVSKMIGPEIAMFERLTKEWYETFFDERSGRMLQSLQLDARNMETTIEVSGQKVYLSADESVLFNKITYTQTIAYIAKSNNADAEDYIALPFKDFDANTEYGEILKSELDAFQGLQSPLPIPKFETSGDDNDDQGSSIGVIVGASIGGAVLLVIALFVGIRVNKRRDGAGEGQSLPSAAGVIVYDGHGEALAPQTLAAPAVLLPSDNPSTPQEDTAEVQTPSAGSLKPSSPQQVIDTPVPEPTAVSTPSDGYIFQFKDQTSSAAPERIAQRDP